MSRSHRKNPFWSFISAKSQKEDKRFGNRRLRRKSKQLVDKWAEVDPDLILPIMDEVLDVWCMPKDGTGHYEPFEEKDWWWEGYYSYGHELTPYKAWFLQVMAK